MAAHHSLNNAYFTTFDRDNNGSNCGVTYKGGWWYKNCAYFNLNALHTSNVGNQRIVWYHGGWIYYPSVEMKVRPKTCVHSNTAQCDQ